MSAAEHQPSADSRIHMALAVLDFIERTDTFEQIHGGPNTVFHIGGATRLNTSGFSRGSAEVIDSQQQINETLLVLGGLEATIASARGVQDARLTAWHGRDPHDTAKHCWTMSVGGVVLPNPVSTNLDALDRMRLRYTRKLGS